jgi:hypothetical protein
MWLWFPLVIAVCALLPAVTPSSSAVSGVAVARGVIDEQLYSRQLLVYGSAAQHALAGAAVLVHGHGYLHNAASLLDKYLSDRFQLSLVLWLRRW